MYEKPQICELTLRIQGLSAATVEVKFSPDVQGVSVSPTRLIITPRLPQRALVSIPGLQKTTRLGLLTLEVYDVPLDLNGDPWQARVPRMVTLPLVAEVNAPARVWPVQSIAFFRADVGEREIELRNDGDLPVQVFDIYCPLGYTVEPMTARVPPRTEGGSVKFRVSRKWEQMPETEAPLVFRLSNGASPEVILRWTSSGSAGPLDNAIIGIDFGTAFTSIAFRQCLYRRRDDDVEFLRPPGEASDRFPTRLWVGHNGDFLIGDSATAEYHKDPSRGWLFREIKTLLRTPDDVHVHPNNDKFPKAEAIRQMQLRFGPNWPEQLVTTYLNILYRQVIRPALKRRFQTEDVSVQYVFSLPVLDYASGQVLYNEQIRKMKKCIEAAGYPVSQNKVQFQFEPVCASIGLLYLTDDRQSGSAGERILGGGTRPIRPGSYVAVFDSGGGTTDIALTQAQTDDGGRILLNVVRCLGVDSRAATFGGEAVTTRLLAALLKPSGAWHTGGPYSFDDVLGVPFTQTGFDADMENDLAVRDITEKFKTELANKGVSETVTCGSIVIRPAELLFPLVTEDLASLGDALLRQVFDIAPREEVYYVAVGGNTYLPPVKLWVSFFMKDSSGGNGERRLAIPDEYRKLAIAYGAVWVPDARIPNAIPYDLKIMAGSQQILRLERNLPQEMNSVSPPIPIEPRQSMVFNVSATIDGKTYSLASEPAGNPHNAPALLNTRTEVKSGNVRFFYSVRNRLTDDDGPEILLLSYRL